MALNPGLFIDHFHFHIFIPKDNKEEPDNSKRWLLQPNFSHSPQAYLIYSLELKSIREPWNEWQQATYVLNLKIIVFLCLHFISQFLEVPLTSRLVGILRELFQDPCLLCIWSSAHCIHFLCQMGRLFVIAFHLLFPHFQIVW